MVKALSKHNVPPSDHERSQIIEVLRDLETEFQSLIGQPFTNFTDPTQGSHLPPSVSSHQKYIPLHRTILSVARRIPFELWQRIFFFVVHSREGFSHPVDVDLRAVCSVSTIWRSAATTYPSLWTQLPPIRPIRRYPDTTMRTLKHSSKEIKTYLLRSATLPITLTFELSYDIWNSPSSSVKNQARENLRLLTDQCHRWEVVSITLPVDAFSQKPLQSIKGKLFALQKLCIATSDSQSPTAIRSWEPLDLSCFLNIESLREVSIADHSLKYPSMGIHDESFSWPRLEKLDVTMTGDQGVQLLVVLGKSQLPHLKILKYLLSTEPLRPVVMGPEAGMLTLPELQVLEWNPGPIYTDLTPFLDRLFVPSLMELHLEGRSTVRSQYTRSITEMLSRSGCAGSLTRLGLCGLDISISMHIPCRTLLLRNHNISHLCLPFSLFFDSLQIYPEELHGRPFLPNLRSLTICNIHDFIFSDTGELEAADLMAMVRSRTVDIKSLADDGYLQALEEVHILTRRTDLRKLKSDWRLMETKHLGSSDDTLTEWASKAGKCIRQCCWQSSRRTTIEQCRALDATMQTMEAIDLSQHKNVEVLTRMDIPYLLHKISHEDRPDAIPGNQLFQLQPRARKLCEKWKPFLLRDASRSPFYWTILDSGAEAVIRYQPKALDEEELWDRILNTE